MRERLALFLIFTLALAATTAWLGAESPRLENLRRRADGIGGKRVEPKLWKKDLNTRLGAKRFPLKEWDKHFSPLGSKRAPIVAKEAAEKEVVEKRIRSMPEYGKDLSRWNDKMADLRERAGLDTDDTARLVSDRRTYGMMLQDVSHFRETAEALSLREINRYQFRRNRPEGPVPVERAGGE